MIGGSQASMYYGEPRVTRDIDVVVELRAEHLSGFLGAFPPGEYDADGLGRGSQAPSRHQSLSDMLVRSMIVSLVRFASRLTDEEVQAKFEARAEAYESVPGLIEKLYLHYRNGDFGAVYVWEDEEAFAAFQASELGSSIADAYRVEGGAVGYEVADVTLAVRPTNA